MENLIADGAYREFYMHSVSHWLGMDVHDVGDYKVDSHWRVYEPGMLLTIEPGIYISAENLQVDKKWRGIGVRIEDDILVTKKGYEILTDGVPKQRDQIEKLMAQPINEQLDQFDITIVGGGMVGISLHSYWPHNSAGRFWSLSLGSYLERTQWNTVPVLMHAQQLCHGAAAIFFKIWESGTKLSNMPKLFHLFM